MTRVESFIGPANRSIRALTWGSGAETVLFLHGLSGVAEVWMPTIAELPAIRRYVAIDQRGHGQSHAPDHGYSAAEMLRDLRGVLDNLGQPVHLVGHSMGARIALVAAARFPSRLKSVAIVDIGPEADKSNIEATVRGLASRPESFASEREALAFAFRSRTPTWQDEEIFLARLRPARNGTLVWRASSAALAQAVSIQRSRSYWREWRSIHIPGLFVHGGASTEVSTAIADKMVAANPRIRFQRLEGIGHNIPLIAPGKLANLLESHWTTTASASS